ncbi:unnamed protein product [Effrenium voratum]|uniref:EF-hand domain-containing protein n=1 Tax=Effrenium voratum TaxID=2562239 RepID=A0AA36N0I2_9DINO|nr:unnamed protein product [Effrenium voratum]
MWRPMLHAVVLAVLLWPAASAEAWRPRPLDVNAPVLQEPTVQQYWHFLQNYTEVPLKSFDQANAPPVLRVTNLDDATFQQLVRDGVPFVVDDCTRGFDEDAISEFECKDFADRWPSGNMRAEYTPGQYHIYLKEPDWYTNIYPQRSNDEHMAGSRKIAGPYIWHVKDEEPLKTKRSVQKHWRTPYFLEKSLANRVEANESFEFWFSLAGGGTFSHADAYCETTISMQFKGTKRWRIQAFPEIRHYFNASAFGDEQIYNGKQHVRWTPETEFNVGPGQCFIFPTGYIHETFVDPDRNDHKCYTASTFQFNHPRQVNLYRSYMSRFSMSHYGMGEPCLDKIESYATLLQDKSRFTAPPDKQNMLREAERVMQMVDSNGDGQIVASELYDAFAAKKKATRKEILDRGDFRYNWRSMLTAKQKEELTEESMRVWVEDALQYHDVSRDGQVTLEELAYNFLHWNVVRSRQLALRKIREKKPEAWVQKALEIEKDYLRRFFCEDPACPALAELERYGEHMKSSKKAAKAAFRKVRGMFEGEEGDEVLTMVDRTSGNQEAKRVSELKSEL